MAAGEIDGEPAVIIQRRGVEAWEQYSAVRLHIVNHRVAEIIDYMLCPWILEPATSIILATP